MISYPSGLIDGENSGPRVTFRHQPGGFPIKPQISVAMSKDSQGEFSYVYTVNNRSDAQKAIRFFKIVAASHDNSIRLDHPRWPSTMGSPNVAPEAGPQDAIAQAGQQEGWQAEKQAARVQAHRGKFAGWLNSTHAQPIEPGKSETGFRARSMFRPGFTVAYSTTGEALRTPGPLPRPVEEQLFPEISDDKSYNLTLTFGPKFGPGAPHGAPWMASEYSYGIQRLIVAKLLSEDSPCVKEALAMMQTVMGMGRAELDQEDSKTAPISITAKPPTLLERELLQAMQLAFLP